MKGDKVLGGVIRATRHEAGLSQSEVEYMSGIPKARLSRYENGHVTPSLASLERIAKGLGTLPSDMLRRAGR